MTTEQKNQNQINTQDLLQNSIPTHDDFCEKCNYLKTKCQCARIAEESFLQEQRQQNWDINRLGGPRAYINFTLEKFQNPDALKESECYHGGRNLFLFGPAGTGKTHLAVALVRRYPEAQVFKPQKIFRDLRGKRNPEQEEELLSKYVDMSHLVIDDLGTEKKTDFSYSCIYEILDGRWMNYAQGLIITSNLNLDELTQRIGDDRLCSRIAGMCKIIELSGVDRRLT